MADYPTTPAPLDHGMTEEKEWRTAIFPAERGAGQRDAQWSSPRRKWTLTYEMLDDNTIWNFFDTYKGAGITFTFNPHDFQPDLYADANVTVAFASDNAIREIRYKGRTFQVVELLEDK